MRTDGAGRHVQPSGNFLVRISARHEVRDSPLGFAEAVPSERDGLRVSGGCSSVDLPWLVLRLAVRCAASEATIAPSPSAVARARHRSGPLPPTVSIFRLA